MRYYIAPFQIFPSTTISGYRGSIVKVLYRKPNLLFSDSVFLGETDLIMFGDRGSVFLLGLCGQIQLNFVW